MRMIRNLAAVAAFFAISTPVFAGELSVKGVAKLDDKGKIAISGTGFPAGAEITLIFATADGVESDISYALEPAPIADVNGRFTTTWAYGRFVKKKLVATGDFVLKATDTDFSPLGETKITFSE